MPLEPLDDIEKAYFDTLLNGSRVDNRGIRLTLIRMQTVEGDPVAVVCAIVHGSPLGQQEGLQPLAMLLTDKSQIDMLRTPDGREAESFDPADFAVGDASEPVPLSDPLEEVRVPEGHKVPQPSVRPDGSHVALCPCGYWLEGIDGERWLDAVIAHWKEQA